MWPPVSTQHLHVGSDAFDPRRADEHCVHVTVEAFEGKVALKRINLAAKGVATHSHIDGLERDGGAALDAGVQNFGGQQDHPCARAVGRHAFGQTSPQRLEQFEFAKQVAHRGGLAAGYHQRVDGLELGDAPNGRGFGTRLTQRGQMFSGVALQREHTDARRTHGV